MTSTMHIPKETEVGRLHLSTTSSLTASETKQTIDSNVLCLFVDKPGQLYLW